MAGIGIIGGASRRNHVGHTVTNYIHHLDNIMPINTIRLNELAWQPAVTPDGRQHQVAPVTQEPLRSALDSKRQAPNNLHGLTRFLNRIDRPQIEVSARQFELLKEYEPIQQRVSQLVGQKANTVVGVLASGGAAEQRLSMANAKTMHFGQYSQERAHGTVQYGSGVCVTVNNVLFRVTAEMTARRALGRRMRPSQHMPVYFEHNAGHGYVRIGDLRDPSQARDVIVGDVWDSLPIIKTWSNFADANLPAYNKGQQLPGQGMSQTNSLHSFAATAQRRVDDGQVDAALAATGKQRTGDRLINQVYDRLNVLSPSDRGLHHVPSLARQPTLTYRNAENGEIFTPSVGIYDLQQVRLAAAHPRYDQFVALTPQHAEE